MAISSLAWGTRATAPMGRDEATASAHVMLWGNTTYQVRAAAGRSMIQSIKTQVSRFGYAFLPGYRSGAKTVAVARDVGVPLAAHQAEVVRQLVPRTNAPPNSYSGVYGLDA